MNWLIQIDHKLFFLINNGLGREWLDPVFYDLTMLGGWTIVLVLLALLSNAGRKVFLRHLAVLTVALLVFSPVTSVLKQSFKRSRPLKCFQEQIEKGDVTVRVTGEPLKRKSFPSGHSMLVFFSMTYAAFFRKELKWLLFLLAGLIAFSRIYVGAHFPSDCIAGALLGAFGAWCAVIGYRKAFEGKN